MVHPSLIEARLGKLGFKTSRWFRAEINELQHVLMEDEEIISLACGRYYGSFALLVATDQRLLLIDKRVFFMTIEDTRYDMISEIDYNSQAYNATVSIYTMNKTHKFTSIRYKRELRELTTYVQRRVWQLRQQQPSDSDVPMAMATPAYQPARKVTKPSDYVQVQDKPPRSPHDIRARVSHVAHLVGSAATHAAHHHQPAFHHKPFSPYSQGSRMTRQPLGSPGYVRY
jgi:hypothetical protein